jgi:Uma2 family endonuclease
VLLLIEVGDSSFLADRRSKLPRYARAGIRETWLANLEAGAVERHTNPDDSGYRDVVTLRRGQRLASTVVAGLTLAGDQILGPA